MSPHK